MAENLTVQTSQVQLGLDLFLREQAFALMGVAPVYRYEDGGLTVSVTADSAKVMRKQS